MFSLASKSEWGNRCFSPMDPTGGGTGISADINPRIRELEAAGVTSSIDGIGFPPSAWLEMYHVAGVSKCTTNPAIFEKAITSTAFFDRDIRELAAAGRDAEEVTWELMIRTVREAADYFLPSYKASRGETGLVSLELHPDYANDE